MFNLSPDHLPFDIECPDVESLRSAMQLCCEFEQDRYEQEMSAGEPINLSDLIIKVSPTETPFMAAWKDAVVYGTGMYHEHSMPHGTTGPINDCANLNVASAGSEYATDPHLGPWPISGGEEPSHSHGVTDYGHECNRPGPIMPGDKLPGGDDIFEPSALTYARNLAQSIYDKHFKASESPQVQWRPLNDLLGVLTQIDNLVAGLVKTNHFAPHDWDVLLELMIKHEWKPEHGPIIDVLTKWLDQFVMESATRQGYELKLQEMDGANRIAGKTIQNLQKQLQVLRANVAEAQPHHRKQVEDLSKSREYWREKYKKLRASVKSAL